MLIDDGLFDIIVLVIRYQTIKILLHATIYKNI